MRSSQKLRNSRLKNIKHKFSIYERRFLNYFGMRSIDKLSIEEENGGLFR